MWDNRHGFDGNVFWKYLPGEQSQYLSNLNTIWFSNLFSVNILKEIIGQRHMYKDIYWNITIGKNKWNVLSVNYIK